MSKTALIMGLLCAVTLSTARAQIASAQGAKGSASGFEPHAQIVGDSSIRLGRGDLLEVSVYNVPELTTKSRVGSNGDIYLPLIDYVKVAALTIDQAQAVIEKRLSDGGFVKNPHVTIFVDEFSSQTASVLGEVAKPGIYPVLGEQRLIALISAAGGLSEKAGRSITITHAGAHEKPTILSLTRNLSDNPDVNVEIRPADVVVVHRADVIYVVGDVGHPAGFLMDSGSMTVLQAIALAGGANKTAKLNGAKVIHKAGSGMIETPVDLKKILQAKAPDLELQANDILFVPSSTTRILGGHTLAVALQAATAVSIVAVRP